MVENFHPDLPAAAGLSERTEAAAGRVTDRVWAENLSQLRAGWTETHPGQRFLS